MQKKMYELVVVLPASDEIEAIRKTIESIVVKAKMEINTTDEWGERPLAYPIRKHVEGVYIVYGVSGEGSGADKLRDLLKLEKRLLRWLMVSVKA